MSDKDQISDQIVCKSIKLAGPIQGKKIQIQVDVKPIQEEKKPKPDKNSDWQILGFLFLILFLLIVAVGNSHGLASYSNPDFSPSPWGGEKH